MTEGVDRSELRQIVAGLSEGVVLVETDGRIAWANAAALRMHGAEATDALGRDVADYRQRFRQRYRNKRPPDLYPIERVAAGEAFDHVVVELARADGSAFEAVHAVRGLVTRAAGGAPGCRALVLRDVTHQYEAEERFERTFAANPAPAVICRLSDLRHVKVNPGFLEMTGYTREEVIGRSVRELDVLARARHRDLALARLKEGGTIPQMEACLRLPGGGTRFVIVAGQPIEMGDEPCMLFTFADLELRKKAETALRLSEERFAKAFRLTPVPTLVARAKGFAVTSVNTAFTRVFGYGEDVVVGRSLDEAGMWVKPGDRTAFEAGVLAGGGVLGVETCLRREDGTQRDCLVSAERISIGEEASVLMVLQDITDRKRGERELFSAIETVMADTSWFSRGLIEKLAGLRHPDRDADRAAGPKLTLRERQVLGLIASGAADEAIAARLGLSRNTVRNHTAALYRKLGLHKRSEVVVWGRDNGFLGHFDGSKQSED